MNSRLHNIPNRTQKLPPLRVGIGGPVGSGKTTLLEMLCKNMRERWDLIAITNDIYTKEDQRLLTVAGALDPVLVDGLKAALGNPLPLRCDKGLPCIRSLAVCRLNNRPQQFLPKGADAVS